MRWIYTGVFATEDEKNQCFAAAALKDKVPYDIAYKAARDLCYKYALSHGLPEIEGYYGMTGAGEFISL